MTSAPLQPDASSEIEIGQRTDLDFVRGQPAPRTVAAWKRLASRADPVALYLGYALVWLLLACLAAALPIIIVGLLPGPSLSPPVERNFVLATSALSFVACWPVFIWWVRQRQRRAQAFVRDAVLLDGVIAREAKDDPGRGMGIGATASFMVDGYERRADLGIGSGYLEGAASILFAPDAPVALVFPDALHGGAVRAHVRGEIVDRAGLVTVVLRREFIETFLATFLGLIALLAPVMAAESPGAGGSDWPVVVVIALLNGWLCLLLADGWRTSLTFDGASKMLTITKEPALAPPWRRTLPLSSIAAVDLRSGMLFMSGVVVKALRLRLRDASGKVLFSRWQLTGADMKREIEEVLQKVRSN